MHMKSDIFNIGEDDLTLRMALLRLLYVVTGLHIYNRPMLYSVESL
jgi:hypothetical protein